MKPQNFSLLFVLIFASGCHHIFYTARLSKNNPTYYTFDSPIDSLQKIIQGLGKNNGINGWNCESNQETVFYSNRAKRLIKKNGNKHDFYLNGLEIQSSHPFTKIRVAMVIPIRQNFIYI